MSDLTLLMQKFIYDFKVINGEGRRSIKGAGRSDDGNKANPPRILSQLITKKSQDEEVLYQPHITRFRIIVSDGCVLTDA